MNSIASVRDEPVLLVAEAAHDVLYRYSLRPEPRFEYLSPAVVVVTGYKPEEFYRDPTLPFGPADLEARQLLVTQLNGGNVRGEALFLRSFHRDGSEVWTEHRCSGVSDTDDELVVIEGIARDVTRRKRVEDGLKCVRDSLEKRLRECTEQVVRANDALIEEVGRRQGTEAELRRSETLLRSALAKAAAVGAMTTGNEKFTGSVADVIDDGQLENALQQSQKMETVGALAAGVAHDFNNLLQGIAGCADLALARLPPDSQARRYLDALKAAAYNGADIVRQLMDFSGQHERRTRVVDLNRVVSNCETLLGRLLGEDVALRLCLARNEILVRCDPVQIEQALMNLLVNARHAMPRGGQVDVETDDVEILEGAARLPGLTPGRYATLTVRDTGHGMDEKTKEQVFEPFFTTKGLGKGTGLGLSGVYAIVTSVGGHIRLESQVGQGTTFTIYLPRSGEPVSGDSDAPRVETRGGGETILLTEDEPLVRLAIRHYLERHGYRVLEASDAEEGLYAIDTFLEQIHLLLTDVALPRGCGAEFARQAQRRRPSLRVVFISGHPGQQLVDDSRLERGTRLVQKPFREAELLQNVRESLDEVPNASASASRPVAPTHRVAAVPADTAHHKTVLLVEDDPLSRKALCEMLLDSGYEVIQAEDESAAQRAWSDRKESIDAIVTDISLSADEAPRLVRRLRSDRPGLPAFFVSGHRATDACIEGILSDPMTAFLQKPVRLEEFLTDLAHLLDQAEHVSSPTLGQ